eukprot:2202006-Rhodomonas_salina.1
MLRGALPIHTVAIDFVMRRRVLREEAILEKSLSRAASRKARPQQQPLLADWSFPKGDLVKVEGD